MNQKPSSPESRLVQVWKSEIELLERLRAECRLVEEGEDWEEEQLPGNLPEILAALKLLWQSEHRLQDSRESQKMNLGCEAIQMRDRKRATVSDAIAAVRNAEEIIGRHKIIVLEQLTDVNQAQAGYDGYRNRPG